MTQDKGMMTCPHCKGKTSSRNKICFRCGRDTTRPANNHPKGRCQSCGGVVLSAGRKCQECGKPVSAVL